jgi:hypothetical protein
MKNGGPALLLKQGQHKQQRGQQSGRNGAIRSVRSAGRLGGARGRGDPRLAAAGRDLPISLAGRACARRRRGGGARARCRSGRDAARTVGECQAVPVAKLRVQRVAAAHVALNALGRVAARARGAQIVLPWKSDACSLVCTLVNSPSRDTSWRSSCQGSSPRRPQWPHTAAPRPRGGPPAASIPRPRTR